MAIFTFRSKRPNTGPPVGDQVLSTRPIARYECVTSEDLSPPPLMNVTDLVLPSEEPFDGPESKIDGDPFDRITFTFPVMEADMNMEGNDRVPPVSTFAAAEMDVDMIDRTNAAPGAPTSSNGTGVANAVELAHHLADAVQGMSRRLEEQTAARVNLEQRLDAYRDAERSYETLKQKLAVAQRSSVADEDVETLQRVLQALAQDPNHIMVLASVAQQAQKLQALVADYSNLRAAARSTIDD